jgi:hypothetical protein
MPHTLTAQVEALVYLAIGLFALWKGGRYERIVAALFLASLIVVPVLQDRVHYQDPQGRLYLFDAPEALFLIWLAVRTGAAWLIVEAALQLLCFTTEAVHTYAHQSIGALTYITLLVLWTMAMFLTLLIATLMALRRRSAGRDPAPA